MEEAQQHPSTIKGQEDGNEPKSPDQNEINNHHQAVPWIGKYKWWIQMAIYALFVLGGGTVATLLGNLYYEKGGKSRWMATFVQVSGFPISMPILCISQPKIQQDEGNIITKPPASPWILGAFYVFLGIFLAADCMLYSIGLQYLPVSTYTLISASQLGFNALFSFFLNKQKFTPYIINSLVLLTVSSALLVFQQEPADSNAASRDKYPVGFICTVAASAGYALMLSMTQLVFQKIIKRETFRSILDMSNYQNLVASVVILIGLFASGDWRTLNTEMENFELGKVSYVMNLFWTAVSWQAFTIGSVGLIFKVSSLFSNVISILSLPLAPVLAVIFFHEKMSGLKIISMLLAIWGFVSYMYQHYLDDQKIRTQGECPIVDSEVSLI